MKAYFFLLTALFYIVHAKAQQNNIFKNKPWEDFRKKELLTQKLNQMNLESNNNNRLDASKLSSFPMIYKLSKFALKRTVCHFLIKI